MKTTKRRRRMPSQAQWKLLRGILGNGWGDGDYGRAFGQYARCRQSIRAFEEWLEDRYQITFTNRIV